MRIRPVRWTQGVTTWQHVGPKLGSEVRQSLSLIGMTALTLLASIGLGILAGHIG